MKVILLGPPAAGKGTQAIAICSDKSIPQISTGDMLRAAIEVHSLLGEKVKSVMESGNLVPDDLIISLVQKRIAQADCKNGFLLDGFPRTLAQAQALKDNHISIDFVIEIAVPDDQIISRISGRRTHLSSGRSYHITHNPPKVDGVDDISGEPLIQREDDHEETVAPRLATYHKETEPLIKYYQAQEKSSGNPKHYSISGVGSLAEVSQRILQKLN